MIFNLRTKEVLGVVESNNTKLVGSYDSVLKINEIGGVCEQGENPTPTNPQEIKNSVVSGVKTHRKNFLKNTATSKTVNGVTFTVNSDGTVTVNGTATADVPFVINYVPLKKGNYILSGCPKGGAWNTYSIQYNFSKQEVGDGLSFTLDKAGSPNIRILVNNGVTVSNLIFKPMIRMADVADDTYEPYRESVITLSQPIELCGVGDVKDVITPKQTVRKLAKVVFNGSEYWNASTALTGRYFCSNLGCNSGGKVLCTQAKSGNYNTTTINECYLSSNSGGQFRINTEFATVEEWKAHLQANPMTVIYELADPVIEELPKEDQLALNSLQTFNGVTYVEFDSEVQPTLNCDYATSPVGAVALSVNAYNEIEKNFVTYNTEDGSANFTGNINGAAYVYGKNLQARQAVFAELVKTWYDVEAQRDVKAANNVEAGEYVVGNNLQAKQMVFAQAVEASMNLISKGGITGVDLNITNLGINGGAPQPVEWVWDSALSRWVLCSTETQG